MISVKEASKKYNIPERQIERWIIEDGVNFRYIWYKDEKVKMVPHEWIEEKVKSYTSNNLILSGVPLQEKRQEEKLVKYLTEYHTRQNEIIVDLLKNNLHNNNSNSFFFGFGMIVIVILILTVFLGIGVILWGIKGIENKGKVIATNIKEAFSLSDKLIGIMSQTSDELRKKEKLLEEKNLNIKELEAKLKEAQSLVDTYQLRLNFLENRINFLEKNKNESKYIEKLKKELQEKESKIITLENKIRELNEELKDRQQQIENLQLFISQRLSKGKEVSDGE